MLIWFWQMTQHVLPRRPFACLIIGFIIVVLGEFLLRLMGRSSPLHKTVRHNRISASFGIAVALTIRVLDQSRLVREIAARVTLERLLAGIFRGTRITATIFDY